MGILKNISQRFDFTVGFEEAESDRDGSVDAVEKSRMKVGQCLPTWIKISQLLLYIILARLSVPNTCLFFFFSNANENKRFVPCENGEWFQACGLNATIVVYRSDLLDSIIV